MEFTYRLSEEDYLLGYKMEVGRVASLTPQWPKYVYSPLLFVFLLVAVTVGWVLGGSSVDGTSAGVMRVVQESVAPAPLIFILYFLAAGVIRRFHVKVNSSPVQLYRSDPSIGVETTLAISAEGTHFRNDIGRVTRWGWEMYEGWLEGGGILLIVTKMRYSFIVKIGGLSDFECGELRLILSEALPQKK